MVHTVLVVDGEPAQRDLLTHSLQNRLGYRAISAACASEVEACFSENSPLKPDLILLDRSVTTGNSTEANFRQLAVYAPLIVLVKYGDYETAVTGLYAGASDFLVKPVAMERISTTFRNLLLLRDAQRELERLRHEGPTPGAYPSSPSSIPEQFLALVNSDGNIRRMEDIENEAIRFAMQYYHGHMTEVARRLGIGRSTLYRKLGSLSTQTEAA